MSCAVIDELIREDIREMKKEWAFRLYRNGVSVELISKGLKIEAEEVENILAEVRLGLSTIADIENLPEGQRAELIDGVIYDLSAPSTSHQELSGFLQARIWNHIRKNAANCKVFAAPFDVQLDADEYTLVQPDISVICDEKKLTKKGCVGAPDWVIEVVSPNTSKVDFGVKLKKYIAAGVREYWIVDPSSESVFVAKNGDDSVLHVHSFSDPIRSEICQGLWINMPDMQ